LKIERTRIIKKLLQKGANKQLKDHKGKSPFDHVDKNKTNIANMLKDKNKCQLCVFKAPLSKIEKNNFNITFFLVIHFIIESLVFTIILPCNPV
jgi:hypothetical protein